jgi:hypothetical protein
MNDHERIQSRAIWKLEQVDYRVERQAGRYLITSLDRADELDNLAALVTYAEAVYKRLWAGRTITPSA